MIKDDVRKFALRVLRSANGQPIQDQTLHDCIRNGFSHVAFTEADLDSHVRSLESDKLIIGITHKIHGPMWALTPEGSVEAAQIR